MKEVYVMDTLIFFEVFILVLLGQRQHYLWLRTVCGLAGRHAIKGGNTRTITAMNNRFNIRVYGIWIADGRVLVNEELIRGKHVIKFPGGGLDWGEGTIACLKREWREELDIDIEVVSHFYTTDFFQPSAYDDSQVISIYYLVRGEVPGAFVNLMANEQTLWMDMKDVSGETFTLPIDKKVGELLRATFGG